MIDTLARVESIKLDTDGLGYNLFLKCQIDNRQIIRFCLSSNGRVSDDVITLCSRTFTKKRGKRVHTAKSTKLPLMAVFLQDAFMERKNVDIFDTKFVVISREWGKI